MRGELGKQDEWWGRSCYLVLLCCRTGTVVRWSVLVYCNCIRLASETAGPDTVPRIQISPWLMHAGSSVARGF